jgi:FkbM family methyltransferase
MGLRAQLRRCAFRFRRSSRLRRGVPLIPLLELIYGSTDEELVRRVKRAGVTSRITTLAQLRTIVACSDRQAHPTPVDIRFGVDDVEWVRVNGLELAVDRADPAVSTQIAADGWEPHVTGLFERLLRPGMSVADVGANVGYFTVLSAGLVGPSGHVYAFDPNPENCRLIALSVDRNAFTTVRLFPVALGASNDHAYFTHAIGSNGGIAAEPSLTEGNVSMVPVCRLDSLLDRDVDLLKIDVEGAEHLVVQGALALIDRARPVVVSEFSTEMISRVSRVRPADYLGTLTARDYRLFVIERSGELRGMGSPQVLLDAWPHPLHIEDLLLVPRERAAEVVTSLPPGRNAH